MGKLLAGARHRARLSQTELARRAGVHRSLVNKYERGVVIPSLAALEGLLAAAGFRVRMDLEPLDGIVDAALQRQAGKSLAGQVRELGLPYASWLDEVDYRLVGNTAALLLGAPVVVEVAELAIADTDDTLQSLARCQRERRFWVFDPHLGFRAGLGPEPVAMREDIDALSPNGWLLAGVGIHTARVRLASADEVARRVAVEVDGRTYWVAPVHELATLTDPLARRYLQRHASHITAA